MSTRKGHNAKRGQRHKNSWAFKPGLYSSGSHRSQDIRSLPLAGLCARCKDKIEWKRTYDKYKPLSAPIKCTVCGDHKVKQAYYHICRECSTARGVCGKCGKTEEIVERYSPTVPEKEKTETRLKERETSVCES